MRNTAGAMIPGADGWTLDRWYAEFGDEIMFSHSAAVPRTELLEYGVVCVLLLGLAFVYLSIADAERSRGKAALRACAFVFMFGAFGFVVAGAAPGLGGAYAANGGITFAHGNLLQGIDPECVRPPCYLPGFSMTMALVWLPCEQGHVHPISTQQAEVVIMWARHRDHTGYPLCCYRIKGGKSK